MRPSQSTRKAGAGRTSPLATRRRGGLSRQRPRLVTGRWSAAADRPGRHQEGIPSPKAIAATPNGRETLPALRNPDPYDPLKDPEKARKREGWPVFEAPTKAEIETVATLRGFRPGRRSYRGARSALLRRLLREAAHGSSPTRSALTFRRDAWTASDWIIGGEAKSMDLAGQHRRLANWPSRSPLDFPKSLLSRAGRIFSRLSILHGAKPPRRKPSRSEKVIDVVGKLGVVAMLGTPPSRRESCATSRTSVSASSRMPMSRACKPKAAGGTNSNQPGREWMATRSRASSEATESRSRISTISRSSTLTNGKRRGTPSRRHSHFQPEGKPMKEGSHIKTKPDTPYKGEAPATAGNNGRAMPISAPETRSKRAPKPNWPAPQPLEDHLSPVLPMRGKCSPT